jgi:hypothetical protein
MLIGQVLDDQPPDHIGHSSPTPRPAGRASVVGVYPDIRFVLSHADGFLPYAFERMALTIALDGGLSPAEVVGAEAVPERPVAVLAAHARRRGWAASRRAADVRGRRDQSLVHAGRGAGLSRRSGNCLFNVGLGGHAKGIVDS